MLQPDGKIVLAGSSENASGDDFALARYNAVGSLDPTFGSGGIVTTPIGSTYDEADDLVLQPDGKLVAAGWVRVANADEAALVRYNTDGSLDTNFGHAGTVVTPYLPYAAAVALQTDGKIVIVSSRDDPSINHHLSFALARYNAEGSSDSSFGDGQGVVTPVGACGSQASAVAVQADGRIVAAGSACRPIEGTPYTISEFGLARYFPNDPGAADHLSFMSSTDDLAAGVSRTLTVQVGDVDSNRVPASTTVTFTQTSGTGTVSGLGSATTANGIATLTVTGGLRGPVTITASASGLGSASTSFNILAGAADHLAFTSSTRALAAGISRPLTVQVEDAQSNGVDASTAVTFTQTSGTGRVNRLGTATASHGLATFTVAGRRAGRITIRASASGLTSAITTFKVVAGRAKKLAFEHAKKTLKLGKRLTLEADLKDAFGNLVLGSPKTVRFAKASGTGGVKGLGRAHTSAGRAHTRVTAVRPGRVTLKATASGLAAATMRLRIVR